MGIKAILNLFDDLVRQARGKHSNRKDKGDLQAVKVKARRTHYLLTMRLRACGIGRRQQRGDNMGGGGEKKAVGSLLPWKRSVRTLEGDFGEEVKWGEKVRKGKITKRPLRGRMGGREKKQDYVELIHN